MPNLSRKNMPQVKTQDLGKALDMVADKVRVTKETIPASKLKKSQKELYKDKVKGIANRFNSPKDMKPLIISKDNHIVDGHHRWSAAIYKWGEDVKIPVHRINLTIDNAIKLYKHIADTINEAMSIAARKKLARKSKSKLRRGLKKRIKKMKKKRSNSDLQKAAIRKAKTVLMQKMMKKAPADMTMTDRVKFSQKLKPGKIQKVARKILPKLKRAEIERVKKMKARNTQKNEAITIPIEIGDTVLGGKFKNKPIVVKSIDKNEKGDITINGKPLLKFRLKEGVWSKSALAAMRRKPMPGRYFISDENGNIVERGLKTRRSWVTFLHRMGKIGGSLSYHGIPKVVNIHDGKKDNEVVSQYYWRDKYGKGRYSIDIENPTAGSFDKIDPKLVNYKKIEKQLGLSEKSEKEKAEYVKGYNAIEEKDSKRDYKKEYEKYGKSEKAKKYRAELNKYNREKGTYGNGDGKDASHKGGKIVGFEDQSKNRGRREKSRLKKEGNDQLEMMKLLSKAMKTMPGSPKQKKIKQELNKLRIKNGLKPIPESIINEIPMGDLQKIDTFADKKLNPVDVVITDKHFFDRLNDPRNGKEITSAELIGFFKRLSKHKKDFVEFLNKYNSVVAVDDRTNINIPFMKQANKAIAKTVMRKKDFKTPDQKLDI